MSCDVLKPVVEVISVVVLVAFIFGGSFLLILAIDRFQR